ncbi:hypothetical protein WS66_26785 [Burkholderia sp. LA-2-3-30-S1-D2]|nr:hypothetical protein WS66_26785 [Burkholderia sp. LA-2-3-30-S1-D2]
MVACAARTAAAMFGDAPQRHRLPLMRSRILSSDSCTGRCRTSPVAALAAPAANASRSAVAQQSWPDVE